MVRDIPPECVRYADPRKVKQKHTPMMQTANARLAHLNPLPRMRLAICKIIAMFLWM